MIKNTILDAQSNKTKTESIEEKKINKSHPDTQSKEKKVNATDKDGEKSTINKKKIKVAKKISTSIISKVKSLATKAAKKVK